MYWNRYNDHDCQLGNCPLFNVLFLKKMPLDGRKVCLVGSSVGRLTSIVELKGSWFDPCLTIAFLTVCAMFLKSLHYVVFAKCKVLKLPQKIKKHCCG